MNYKVKSVGLILDGNRRWAKKNNLKITQGHEFGLKKIWKTIKWAEEFGIEYLTFYIFSSENWNRSKVEVSALLFLFQEVFFKKLKLLERENFEINFFGAKEKFSKKLQSLMENIEKQTKKKKGEKKLKIYFAISYGGRDEIVNAVKDISKNLSKNKIKKLTEKKFQNFLWSRKIEDPEIIIRTGGAKRLSNFLLWKASYSELFFLDKFWPDFSKKDFFKILEKYKKVKINKGR